MLKKILWGTPFYLFLLVVAFLWHSLSQDHVLPSTLIGKPIPEFSLPTSQAKINFSNKDLLGHITVLHFWASWCGVCAVEHPLLVELASEHPNLYFYGVAYKDKPNDVMHYLSDYKNPYQKVGFDLQGDVEINFGVSGTPETFIIDTDGIIRYKLIGGLSMDRWSKNIWPLIQTLAPQRAA